MARIGHEAWAIAHGKSLVWVKKLKMPKRCEKRFYDHIEVVVCKKPLQKTLNILKKRAV